MTILYFVLAAFYVFGALANIASIGQRRAPMTPGVAIVVLIINSVLAFALVYAAVRL